MYINDQKQAGKSTDLPLFEKTQNIPDKFLEELYRKDKWEKNIAFHIPSELQTPYKSRNAPWQ